MLLGALPLGNVHPSSGCVENELGMRETMTGTSTGDTFQQCNFTMQLTGTPTILALGGFWSQGLLDHQGTPQKLALGAALSLMCGDFWSLSHMAPL